MSSVYVSHGIRPYWHVDVKWIAGIALFVSLSACLALFNFWNLTRREIAVPLTASVAAGFFNQNGSDFSGDLRGFRKAAAKSPSDTITPLLQYPGIQISQQDALHLNPRDLRIAIFSQITGPIYDRGIKGAATQLVAKTADRAAFVQQASVLSLVNQTKHDVAQKLFLLAAVASVILAAVMIYFSAGWGRLVSPGVVLILSAAVGTIYALTFFRSQTGKGTISANLPSSVVHAIADSLTHSYVYAAGLGAALLIIALLGSLTLLVIHRFSN